jgi:N-acetyl-anhydromuramyl-L-alanine amidase AmpD
MHPTPVSRTDARERFTVPYAARQPSTTQAAAVGRRRTLGVCAHCRKPVDAEEQYVRLYRRAWHLDCALVSESRGTRAS